MGHKMKGMKFGNEHMKNQAPKMSKNYSKSGMNNADGSAVPGEGAPFLNGLIGMGKKMIGGAAKFGAFGPLGMMAQKMMAKRKAAKAANNASQQANTDDMGTGVNTDTSVDQTVDTNAPIGSEGTMTPNQEELGTN